MDNKLDTIPIRSDNRRTSNRSDFPFLKLDREWIVKLTSFMTVIALVYVSYLPFLHIFSVLGIEKYQIFPILIFMILGLLLFSYIGQMLCGKIQFHKFNITALSLYMLFAIYTLISFLFTDGIQDDLFTLRTIILVNPIFMILAISCLQNKETVVKMLFVLSGVYLMFPILSIMHNIFQIGRAHV